MTATQRTPFRPDPDGACPLVSWRHPAQARAWGWAEAFGPGPFEVVRAVDHSAQGLRPGLVLKTLLGEFEVSEVWLKPGGPAR
jgi:hypothetical protein